MAFNLIKFKKGTKAGLDTKVSNSQIEEGSFYLTIDNAKETSRLYIGTAANKVLPVNSNITVVTNTSELTASHAGNFNDGDFAYVTNGNILAVRYDGAWTQINAPDSRAVKDLTPSITTSNGVATVQWSLRDQNDNIIREHSDDPSDQIIPNITMQGASGVTVSGSGRAITITGDPATLSSSAIPTGSNATTISLTSTGNTASGSIAVSAGNGATLTGSANSITIGATTNDRLTVNPNATSGLDIAVIDSSEDSVQGTIDPKITLGTHQGLADEISFTPVSYNQGAVVHAVANLPVYTKDEVDALLTDVDAMTYKGLINSTSILNNTSGLHVGDTYKASTSININSGTEYAVNAKPGDLLIVSSDNVEGADGTISGNNIKYDVIPSGDDFYIFQGLNNTDHTGNGIQIIDGSTSDVISSLEVAPASALASSTNNSQIVVTSTHTDGATTNDKAKTTIHISHGLISTSTTGDANTPAATAAAADTQTTHSTKTFNVVTGITTNNGHVTGTTITPIKVVDTVSQIDTSNTELEVETTNNTATVTSTIALVDEANTAINSADLAFSLGSQNLTVTSSGTAITMNYVWETF